MTDTRLDRLREALRSVQAPPAEFESLVRYRDRRERRARVFAGGIALGLLIALLVGAATLLARSEDRPGGNPDAPNPRDPRTEGALYAAVIDELIRGYRGGRIYVIDHVVPDAGSSTGSGAPGRTFSEEVKAGMRSSLPGVDIRFVPSRESVDEPQPGAPEGWTEIPDGVLIYLGEQVDYHGRVLVGATRWQGLHGGLWGTWVVELQDGTWTVTGTKGSVTVS